MKKQLFWAFLLSIMFLLPDLVFKLFYPHYLVFDISMLKEVLAIFVLSFLIFSVKSFALRYLFGIFIAILSLIQLYHFAYFHSYMMPYEVALADQGPEWVNTLSKLIPYIWLPIGVFIAQAIALAYILKRKFLTFKYAPLVIMLLLLLGPISAIKRKRAYIYLPKATSFSFKNTFNALSWYVAKEAFTDRKLPEFKPYIIKELNKTTPANVILVMGESLSSKRMSLFNFPKLTTPHLEARRWDDNFHYTWGYSGGVTTDVSVPTFVTLKREPENLAPMVKNSSNLLALAKKNGYTTYYATTQNLFVIGGVLADFSSEVQVFEGYDQLLLDYLKKLDLNNSRNFVMLHQRNSHSPYEKYTPPQFQLYPFKDKPYKEYMRASYLNSVLYTDWLLDQIFKYVSSLKGCNVVFFTSDHGEMMGLKDEGGRFGHVYLGYEDAKVPMLIYHSKSCPASITKEFNLSGVISHYQFGKIIAKTLGYEVINPNEDGSYYINGVDISGSRGFIKYKERVN
ncbi:MAG: sulfatase-like hydrolase/transferase [Epsilonproteobacteria bacterium]|nr:sulfatase-like hydrolase/transferase [Campylobacterota bacterium]